MEGKKAFSLYTDLIKLVNGSNIHGVEIEPMSDEEAGQLFRWILEYVNDLHPSVPKVIKYAVVQVKKQLDEDLERWKKQCEVNRINGSLGGRPRKPNETENNRMGFEETEQNQTKAKKPDKDKDIDKDKDNNMDKLDKLDKQYTHDTSMLNSSINKQKKHIDDNGLDWTTYMNLDYEIRPYYYSMKLDHIQSKSISNIYKKMKLDNDYDYEIMHDVFFYTLDKILKSEFKADNFIGYFKSIFKKNYKMYLNLKDNDKSTSSLLDLINKGVNSNV